MATYEKEMDSVYVPLRKELATASDALFAAKDKVDDDKAVVAARKALAEAESTKAAAAATEMVAVMDAHTRHGVTELVAIYDAAREAVTAEERSLKEKVLADNKTRGVVFGSVELRVPVTKAKRADGDDDEYDDDDDDAGAEPSAKRPRPDGGFGDDDDNAFGLRVVSTTKPTPMGVGTMWKAALAKGWFANKAGFDAWRKDTFVKQAHFLEHVVDLPANPFNVGPPPSKKRAWKPKT